MAGDFVKVYVKKKVDLGRFSFAQEAMVKIGTVAVSAVRNRVQLGLNSMDAPMAPLGKYYAMRKAKMGRKSIRDLTFTGSMLNELSLRTVSNNSLRIGLTTALNRQKANANSKKEVWLLFSDADQVRIVSAARQVFAEMVAKLANKVGEGRTVTSGS